MLVLRGVVGRSKLHCNDVYTVCTPTARQTLLFFPGDVQAERAAMLTGRYPQFAEYAYEGTLDLLKANFPDTNLFLIQPAYQHPDGRSVYANLLSSLDGDGSLVVGPEGVGEVTTRCQLQALMASVQRALARQHGVALPPLPLVLLGFSKGCLVLNHLLLEEAVDDPRDDAPTQDSPFALRLVRRLIWVDAGNSNLPGAYPGPWPAAVQRFVERWVAAKSAADGGQRCIEIHSTPYMVQLRPRLRVELEQFCRTLHALHGDAFRSTCDYHFAGRRPSLEDHFAVLRHVR
eukprot:EG_transcript_18880